EQLPLVHALEILDGKFANIAGDLRRYGGKVRLQIGIVRALPACPALPTRPVRRHDDEDADGHDEYENPPPEFKNLVPVDLRNAHGSLLDVLAVSPAS